MGFPFPFPLSPFPCRMTWVKRRLRLSPITAMSTEMVRFDTQLMPNPENSGIEYQQGLLAGYERIE
ncbi:HNH endonuclease [Microseira wollei NIES-4236]|uniref:HNH endonuclease n=1 Tax=Microseira wollei NIES-4236 TaxID=2530354 RepID=A0AAV3XLC4_9CYAN|nr:HNH endonuclease [Microseira wollei NIES-4236]